MFFVIGNSSQLACVYSALILVDDVAVTDERISTILKAANVDIEPYWPALFVKALEGINVKDLITNIGSGVGTGGGAAPAAVVPAPSKRRKKNPRSPITIWDSVCSVIFVPIGMRQWGIAG
ncbi:60S acidic ribosomal protein P1-like [Aedes aegypti]|uniref:Large ribosomal subunit protein P1 n=2 Tax=Aedes aegypti TaxID=7159 RepID=A0A903VQW7_AEDAE|nr:60S acidic ribosomal protein P1-like [Aedes aegypti]